MRLAGQAPLGGWRTTLDSPIGRLVISTDGEGLVGVDWIEADPQSPEPTELPELLAEARQQLTAYFAGGLRRFALPLRPAGTRFQRMVWGFIADIPYGSSMSYRELAELVGSGPRAVARACGANPLPLLIPCHRVVGSKNGGGYSGGGGTATKAFLLDLEAADAPLMCWATGAGNSA